jgi:DNA polymerase III sliding clamp (beta) subunit (PCNA family)
MKEQSNNFGNGGGISTSSPYALQKVDNWSQIPSTWKNTNVISKVNFDLNPLDKKFQSIFNKFLGQDELRPVSMGYNVDDYGITVTNSHILAHIPAENSKKGVFNPITGEIIDGKYPQYENVVPKDFAFSFTIDAYKLLQYSKVAMNYANKFTKQILISYDKVMTIGFNAELLIIALESLLKLGYEKVYLSLNSPNRPIVISPVKEPKVGKDFMVLVMPVTSDGYNSKTSNNFIGAMDIDYSLELGCIFDLDRNDILNKNGSVAEFKMDYGMNPIFTDEVIKVIKSSLQKNPTLVVLENFKVQDNTLKVTNIKGYSFSVIMPNINVPNGLYYIQNNVAVKNENADIDDFVRDIDYSVRVKKNSIKINKNYFDYLINTAKNYLGNDEIRPVMMGINFKYDGINLYVASTNANYLCRIKVNEKIGFENSNTFDIVLPIYNINTILESNEDEFIKLDIYSSEYEKASPSDIKIESSSFILEQKLIDGKFPVVNQVIPQTSYFNLNLKKETILNAIKSKEAEAFIKKNKKFDIKIAGKKDNDRLSIFIYTTNDSDRNSVIKIDEIEILNTDLHLEEREVYTTDSCLLLMPVIAEDNIIFSFRLELFKEFIKPVNTDYFDISYTELRRAYLINEQFFKYKETFKKPAKSNKIIEVKPLINKIDKKNNFASKKEETPAETKSINKDISNLNEIKIGMEFYYYFDEVKHKVTSIDDEYVYHVEIDKPNDYQFQRMTKVDDFKKLIDNQEGYKKEVETTIEKHRKNDNKLKEEKELIEKENKFWKEKVSPFSHNPMQSSRNIETLKKSISYNNKFYFLYEHIENIYNKNKDKEPIFRDKEYVTFDNKTFTPLFYIIGYNYLKYLFDNKPKKETPAETKSDLEYLNELLATSNDLLDLISDTGSKADIDFLKQKIEATKDLISLLQ